MSERVPIINIINVIAAVVIADVAVICTTRSHSNGSSNG